MIYTNLSCRKYNRSIIFKRYYESRYISFSSVVNLSYNLRPYRLSLTWSIEQELPSRMIHNKSKKKVVLKSIRAQRVREFSVTLDRIPLLSGTNKSKENFTKAHIKFTIVHFKVLLTATYYKSTTL